MRRRTERRLSEAELLLWTQLARSVAPMPGRTAPDLPEAAPEPVLIAPVPGSFAAALMEPVKPAIPAKSKTPLKPALKPLAPVERRVLTALKRGARSIEAVIDLHGMYQAEAHAALRHFIMRAQQNGLTLVLVVTGKGGVEAGLEGEARGILRRVVPHWLRLADMRSYVLGFEEAARQHGGSGALYIRIRRHREVKP
jgi:DNA-nicking Smr family endonuclease